MPYDTAIQRKDADSIYANKTKNVYRETEISANRVPDLKVKNWNEIFPMEVTVRVVGIEERDVGGDKRETFYRLEIRQAGTKEKNPDEMSSDEILTKIEEEQ